MSGFGLFGGGNQPGNGEYKFPWESAIGGVYDMYTNNRSKQNSQDMLNQIIKSDQWRGQQSRYFEPLHETVTKGIGGTSYGDAIAKAAASDSAAKGYFGSPNMVHSIAKGLDAGTNERIRMLTPLATGRGETQATGLAGNVLGAQNAQMAGLGTLIGDLMRGQQPTSAEKSQGVKPNQNLFQHIGLA